MSACITAAQIVMVPMAMLVGARGALQHARWPGRGESRYSAAFLTLGAVAAIGFAVCWFALPETCARTNAKLLT